MHAILRNFRMVVSTYRFLLFKDGSVTKSEKPLIATNHPYYSRRETCTMRVFSYDIMYDATSWNIYMSYPKQDKTRWNKTEGSLTNTFSPLL